jgi:hypothetical protein
MKGKEGLQCNNNNNNNTMIQLSFVLIDLLTEQANVQLQSHHKYTKHKQTNKQVWK